MLCVVVLSTLAMFYLYADRASQKFRIDFADRIKIISSVATFDGTTATFTLKKELPQGAVLESETDAFKDVFRTAGVPYDVVVQESPSGQKWVSVNFSGGYFSWPLSDNMLSTPARFGIAGYLGLILTGSMVVALLVAYQATKQLIFLEKMAQSMLGGESLPRLPEEGAAEMKATARALNKMGDGFKRLIDSKMRLVAAAGHDLRTPMTRMRLRAEFLDEDSRADWLRDLDEIDRIADSAIQLVREETISKGAELINVDELVRKVCADVTSINLPVTTGAICSAHVQASPLALTRALRNLVINAATHGDGARVTAHCADQIVQIVIDDDGPGIPAEDLSNAVEPFFRVDPARRQHVPGAGLGLAIAKEIIERQGGTLTLSNLHPHGLRQLVTLEMASEITPSAMKVQSA
jgi:signal transduction histidine kinase